MESIHVQWRSDPSMAGVLIHEIRHRLSRLSLCCTVLRCTVRRPPRRQNVHRENNHDL